jgi:hypothetical protein
MEVEIKKTENGYHCKDKNDGEYCFETCTALFKYLEQFLPCKNEQEIKLTD